MSPDKARFILLETPSSMEIVFIPTGGRVPAIFQRLQKKPLFVDDDSGLGRIKNLLTAAYKNALCRTVDEARVMADCAYTDLLNGELAEVTVPMRCGQLQVTVCTRETEEYPDPVVEIAGKQ